MNEFKLIQFSTKSSKHEGDFPWVPAGMGYIAVLPTGRLLVIDGGNPEDAESFVGLLEEYAGGKPEIAAWILTHPHVDHIGVLLRILSEPALGERLTIGRLVCNGPTEKDEPFLSEYLSRKELERFCTTVSLVPSEKLLVPHTGDVLSFDGASLRFFFTQDEIPYQDNYNKMSMIFSLTLGECTVMFTGDAYTEPMQWVISRFGNELHADICQIAHHGLNGGNEEFYRLVGAKTVLVPASKAGYDAMRQEQWLGCSESNRHAEEAAEKVYYEFLGTQEIEL